jgi:hypothetical protein
MKWIIILFALSAVCIAQQPSERPQAKISSLGLKVREVGTKKKDHDNWKSWGSYDRDTTRQKTVEVEVTKFSRDPADGVKVWVLWIARPAQSNSGEFIFKREVLPLNLTKQFEHVTFVSPEIVENNQRYYGYYSSGTYTSGMKLAGYAIGLDYGGETSKPYFSNGVSNISEPAKLKALIAEYEKKGKNRRSSRSQSDQPDR